MRNSRSEENGVKGGPIFLAGIDRSGIGLLCELLEAHPSIAMTRRTNFWSFYFNRFGDLGRSENLNRCLQEMMSFRRMQVLQADPDRLLREFESGETSYASLFELLQKHRAERLGKSRWGDKSLNSERYADTIFAAYPTAKMIHVIRDPRDRCASLITHRRAGRGRSVSAGTAQWLRSVRLAERNVRKYPHCYKVVKYETLVAEPYATLRDICHFVGENYSPAMLAIDAGVGSRGNGRTGNSRENQRAIWTRSVGRFSQLLSAREIAFVQMLLRKEMVRYGYERAPVKLSRAGKILFCLRDCPMHLVRIAGSRALDVITAVTGRGRTPSTRKTGLSTWSSRSQPTMPRTT